MKFNVPPRVWVEILNLLKINKLKAKLKLNIFNF